MNNRQFSFLALSIFVVFLILVFGFLYQSVVTGKAIFKPKIYKAQGITSGINSIACSSNTECNDNNACTSDLCKNIGGYGNYCVHEAISPCCGDGNCETNKGENCASCVSDCTGKKDGCLTGYSCLSGSCVAESK